MYDELKEKGLGFVAVNGFDSADVIKKYLGKENFTFRVAMADKQEGGNVYDIAQHYGVSAYPTNYLVTSDGNVLWRGIGFDEKAIRKALASQGIK